MDNALILCRLVYFHYVIASRILLIISVFVTCHLDAQWRGPRLTRLGPAEGLPATIFDICQDTTGYIYLASNVGMYRYDGHHFEFFGHNPIQENSIGAGEVLTIIAGSDGLIWMTLRFGGLNSFNPVTKTFKRYPLPGLSFKSSPTANGIFEDSDGVLWVGGSHFRLLAFDRATEHFTTYTPSWVDPQHHGGRLDILSIMADRDDPQQLWLSVLDFGSDEGPGFGYGLAVFNKSTQQFSAVPGGGHTKYQDDKSALWGVFWGNFISRYDPETLTADTFQFEYTYQEKTIKPRSRDIIKFNDDLLISTGNAVLRYKDQKFETVIIDDQIEEAFTAMFVDRDQNLWLGTDEGAYIVNPDDQHIRYFSLDAFGVPFRLFPAQLGYSSQHDAIYLSYLSNPLPRGLLRFPLKEDLKNEAKLLPSDFDPRGIAVDHRDRIWVAGKNNFYLHQQDNNSFIASQLLTSGDKPLSGVYLMRSNRAGWIAAASTREFIWFHSDSQHLQRIDITQLPGSPFAKSYDNGIDGFSLTENHKAYLFSNELHEVDLLSGKIRVLKYDPMINPNLQAFQYAGEDQGGNIWISTFVLIGQFELREDSLILKHAYTIDDGMISPTAHELHIDDNGRVWAFTGSGMNCIDPVTHEVRAFSTKEGMPMPFIDPTQVISAGDGRIATVNKNGLIVFNADQLWHSKTHSDETIIITRIRMAGQKNNPINNAQHNDTIVLKAGNTGVDIEFQALIFPTDYNVEYSYRISGIQNEWLSIGTNKLVTLPSLAPGEYTFDVKVGPPQNTSPFKSLHIHVPTPIYQQWWFILGVAVLITILIYRAYKTRINQIRLKEEGQTAINKQIAELELKALRSQMNPHFMFNSLNSIKNYILHAEPKLAAEYLSNFAHLIRLILQNSREKVITLQEELETLMLYIELEQIRFDNQFEFNCMVDKDVSLEQIMIPPMLLQPFIENAIWHGLMHKKEKGHLSLRFSTEDTMVACAIEDDGVGRAMAAQMKSLSANKYKSMGMGITRDRIEIMNKMDALGISTEIIDKTDHKGMSAGTIVIVRIPGASPD